MPTKKNNIPTGGFIRKQDAARKQEILDLFIKETNEYGAPNYSATTDFPSPIYEDSYQQALDYQTEMLNSPRGQEMLREETARNFLFNRNKRNERAFQETYDARLRNLENARNSLLFAPEISDIAYGVAFPDGPNTAVLTQGLRGVPYTVPNMYSPDDLMFTMVHEADHVEKGSDFSTEGFNFFDANLQPKAFEKVRLTQRKTKDALENLDAQFGGGYQRQTGMTKEDFLSNYKNKKKGEKAYYFGENNPDKNVEGHIPLVELYDFDWATSPDEVSSQIVELQFLSSRAGVYDPKTEEFNESHLKKLEQLVNSKQVPQTVFRTFKNLRGLYEDDNLIDIMNLISQDNSMTDQTNMTYAQNGGYSRHQEDGITYLDPNRPISSQTDAYTPPSERDNIAVQDAINQANVQRADIRGRMQAFDELNEEAQRLGFSNYAEYSQAKQQENLSGVTDNTYTTQADNLGMYDDIYLPEIDIIEERGPQTFLGSEALGTLFPFGGMEIIPGPGEGLDGIMFADAVKDGKYGDAALHALGFAFPFVTGKGLLNFGKKYFGKSTPPVARKNIAREGENFVRIEVPVDRVDETTNVITPGARSTSPSVARGTNAPGRASVHLGEVPYYNNPNKMLNNEAQLAALSNMKSQGRYLDDINFSSSNLNTGDVNYVGTSGGRPVVSVQVPGPDGNMATQYFYKSTGLGGKTVRDADGVVRSTEGMWQPFGGFANVNMRGLPPDKEIQWFIKGMGYKDFYNSKAFENIAENLDDLTKSQFRYYDRANNQFGPNPINKQQGGSVKFMQGGTMGRHQEQFIVNPDGETTPLTDRGFYYNRALGSNVGGQSAYSAPSPGGGGFLGSATKDMTQADVVRQNIVKDEVEAQIDRDNQRQREIDRGTLPAYSFNKRYGKDTETLNGYAPGTPGHTFAMYGQDIKLYSYGDNTAEENRQLVNELEQIFRENGLGYSEELNQSLQSFRDKTYHNYLVKNKDVLDGYYAQVKDYDNLLAAQSAPGVDNTRMEARTLNAFRPEFPVEAQRNPVVIKKSPLSAVHNTLAVAGMVPVIGEPLDLLDAALYTLEGDYTGAVLASASSVPLLGSGAGGLRLTGAAKALAKGAEEGSDLNRYIKQIERERRMYANPGASQEGFDYLRYSEEFPQLSKESEYLSNLGFYNINRKTGAQAVDDYTSSHHLAMNTAFDNLNLPNQKRASALNELVLDNSKRMANDLDNFISSGIGGRTSKPISLSRASTDEVVRVVNADNSITVKKFSELQPNDVILDTKFTSYYDPNRPLFNQNMFNKTADDYGIGYFPVRQQTYIPQGTKLGVPTFHGNAKMFQDEAEFIGNRFGVRRFTGMNPDGSYGFQLIGGFQDGGSVSGEEPLSDNAMDNVEESIDYSQYNTDILIMASKFSMSPDEYIEYYNKGIQMLNAGNTIDDLVNMGYGNKEALLSMFPGASVESRGKSQTLQQEIKHIPVTNLLADTDSRTDVSKVGADMIEFVNNGQTSESTTLKMQSGGVIGNQRAYLEGMKVDPMKYKPVVGYRKGARNNPDGRESTHIMAYAKVDDLGGYVAFPTLFQNEQGEFYEPEDPIAEAIKKNEIYRFGYDLESAKEFAAGSWKPRKQAGGLFQNPITSAMERMDEFGNMIVNQNLKNALGETVEDTFGFNFLPDDSNCEVEVIYKAQEGGYSMNQDNVVGQLVEEAEAGAGKIYDFISGMGDRAEDIIEISKNPNYVNQNQPFLNKALDAFKFYLSGQPVEGEGTPAPVKTEQGENADSPVALTPAKINANNITAAIEQVAKGDENLATLLGMTAYMENSYGANPNAYDREYTHSFMSLDDPSLNQIFDIRTGATDYTKGQKAIFNMFESLGLPSDKESFTELLDKDDPLASVAAARAYYATAPEALPASSDTEGLFNYFSKHYNRGGQGKYQTEEESLNRFLEGYTRLVEQEDFANGGTVGETGKILVSSLGVFDPNYPPGKPVIVPTRNGVITMDGVDEDLVAISNRGEVRFMDGDSGNYQFEGKTVLEVPVKMFYGKDGGLADWFKEEWVRIDTEGNITGPCGTMKKGKATTRCLPKKKAQSLSKAERKATARKKVRGSKKGKQFVSNTKKAKVTRKDTKRYEEGGQAPLSESFVMVDVSKMDTPRENKSFTFADNLSQYSTATAASKALNTNDIRDFLKSEGYDVSLTDGKTLSSDELSALNTYMAGQQSVMLDGGELPYQTFIRVTGLSWPEAKRRGFTDGSYEKNIALQNMLLEGKTLGTTMKPENRRSFAEEEGLIEINIR